MIARTLPLLLAVSAGVAAKEDPKLVEAVNRSIDRGVAWILARQTASGAFPAFEDGRGEIYPVGMHCLASLAVVKGLKEPMADPRVRKAYVALRELNKVYQYTRKTYEAGLALMLLDARYNPTQTKKSKAEKVDPEDRELANELAVWIQKKQGAEGMWRYPEGGADLSNTQYAALGLWAAHRLGVDVDSGVVRRMMEAVLARQEPTGPEVPRLVLSPDPRYGKWTQVGKDHARGWRYMPDFEQTIEGGEVKKITYPFSGSMTSAGVAILGIGRDILGKKDSWLTPSMDRKVAASIFDGIAWMAKNFDVKDNPNQKGNWPFYWIYGLERAARIAGVDNVGPHDWYEEGAWRLLADQKPDGSWPLAQRMRPPGDQNVRWWSDQVDTAFAVLFLTRSTPQTKVPPPVVSSGD